MKTNYLTLHQAVFKESVNLVEIILNKNVNIDEVNNIGDTALHKAVYYSNMEIIKLLLSRGADVNLKNDEGQTVLHYAQDEITRILIEYKSNIHNIDVRGCTPLHSACEIADLKTIKLMLKNGADLNARDSKGRTPVMHVLGHPDSQVQIDTNPNPLQIMPFLLDYSEVNLKDKEGNNILEVRENMKCWRFIVVEHVAKLKVLDPTLIHRSVLDYVTSRKSMNKYYMMCVRELTNAKSAKFHDSWVSFFHFIIEDKKKLLKYAGNRSIVEDFNNCNLSKKFPIYGGKMHENFSKAIENRKVWDSATVTLSNILPIFDSFHLIVRNVTDCLTKKDLIKLSN